MRRKSTCRRITSSGSASPDPTEPGLGVRIGWPVLAVAPGSSGAFLVMLLAAGQTDHNCIFPLQSIRAGPAAILPAIGAPQVRLPFSSAADTPADQARVYP